MKEPTVGVSKCKLCSSKNIVKAGFTNKKKQKYLCRKCKRTVIKGDERVKYDKRIHEIALILYENGNGFRRIADILSKIFGLKIYYQTVVKWLLKKYETLEIKNNDAGEICEVLELDELRTFIKKAN
jgi:transposase-like protein